MSATNHSPTRQGQGGGPNTPDGKRRVSRNAITHGLTCRDVVVGGEDGREFAQFRAAMVADAQPVGGDEQNAVERMAACQWKLRRLWRQEADVFATARYRLRNEEAGVGTCLLKDMQGEGGFAQLMRQEAHLDRMYLRASKRLQELQDLRRKGLRHVIEDEQDAAPLAGPAVTPPPAAPAQPIASPTQDPRAAAAADRTNRPAPAGQPASGQSPVTRSDHSASGEITKQTSAPATSAGHVPASG